MKAKLFNITFIKIVIFMLLIASIVPAVPIFKEGTRGVFYNMDPEMAIVANAMTYNRSKIISYIDHPGTPTIFYIATSYIPLRLYAKVVEGTSFITWTFEHFRFLFLYTRLVMVLAFLASVYIYLSAVAKITKNWMTVLFSGLAIFAFDTTLRLTGAVLTETLSFFLISLWLSSFAAYLENKDPIKLVFLSLISGLAIANKYNNFPIFIVSILLVFTLHKSDIKQKLYNIVVNSFAVFLGFIAGTWPVRGHYKYMVSQVLKVLRQSGDGAAHGAGNSSFFDTNAYIESIKNFYHAQPVAVYIFVFVAVFVLFDLLYAVIKKRSLKIPVPFYILFAVTFISTLFIAKYPLAYYQFVNFLLFVFMASYLLSKFRKFAVLVVCIFVAIYALKNYQNYSYYMNQARNGSIHLEEYISSNPSTSATLWDYAPTEDFMRIWVRSWGGGIYDAELILSGSKNFELKADYKTVYINAADHVSIFDACWDSLYIREDRALTFLEIYSDRKFEVKPLQNTGIWEIESSHCATKP
jgi:hypothetical protein